MKYWQMAFRYDGDDYWQCCKDKGIAAIGYSPDGKGREPIVTDCRKILKEEYKRQWREKRPENKTGNASLRRLAYEMEIGDIIYARDGIKAIIGKGEIISKYEYDTAILEGLPLIWKHYVRVKWCKTFPRIPLKLHAPQVTVFELKVEKLKEIQTAEKSACRRQTS